MVEHASLISEFRSIVNCNEQLAQFYLEANNWDLAGALTAYYENPPPSSSSDIDQATNTAFGSNQQESQTSSTQNNPSSSSRNRGSRAHTEEPEVAASSSTSSQVFTGTDGPLMAYDDPENQEFLKAIRSGQNQPVDVRVSRRLDEDYKPPPKKPTRPFSGSGQRLGSITPVVVSSQKFEVDESLPITSLQIRLADGTRMLARFNHTHTVNDIRNFINASRVGEAQRNYLLQTSFPVNDLNDGSQTLEEASLLNSVVIQRYT
ncbi:3695_t:CDS:2 [Entrophospora sp. SA101]|nr:3695_t:CDS:2 [Entrophospora sp. SA101]CAJ0856802.1 15820_t:CDS:2 [Entrophospora sp. SA101]CAJ0860252.1 7453_t:CDS:2 [Entrophospora sp. SA101]CAJ0882664.1 8914_t:CDS:2 [Entrophospora sp. SA101]